LYVAKAGNRGATVDSNVTEVQLAMIHSVPQNHGTTFDNYVIAHLQTLDFRRYTGIPEHSGADLCTARTHVPHDEDVALHERSKPGVERCRQARGANNAAKDKNGCSE
jgi:hypothetical protein